MVTNFNEWLDRYCQQHSLPKMAAEAAARTLYLDANRSKYDTADAWIARNFANANQVERALINTLWIELLPPKVAAKTKVDEVKKKQRFKPSETKAKRTIKEDEELVDYEDPSSTGNCGETFDE